MGTVLWYTLRESFHRRMAIVLIVIDMNWKPGA